MSDLNEKLAQEAAELINGGEWRDGKWYSEGHRDAWRRALKPAADRIEKLKAQLAQSQLTRWAARWEEQADRIEKLEAALRKIKDLHDHLCPEDEQVLEIRDDMSYFIACEALEGKDAPQELI